MPLPSPVIVVPGITASYLRDDYPIPPEFVWKVIKKDFAKIVLHPNDLRFEAAEPARVRPDQIFEIAYEELVEELRYNLTQDPDKPVPVYPFSYDWRQPLQGLEDALGDFVQEVIDRTKLMKHYHSGGYRDRPKVSLLGHSMGGLIITGYLAKAKSKAPVDKVVNLATPYQGSYEAVAKVATGTANLGETSAPSSRERDAARLTPALYHLLPSFRGSVQSETGLPNTLFDSKLWQPGVVDSIATFARRKGLPGAPPKRAAEALFRAILAEARRHDRTVKTFDPAAAGLSKRDWLAVVGVDSETRVGLKVIRRNGKPHFDLSSELRMNRWGDPDPSEQVRTGDGTVPYKGAIPPFLGAENLICVTPDDYGYWELADKAATKLAGFHGILPNMNMLHRLITRFFTGKSDRNKNTWGRAAPGVGAEDWDPPLPLRLKG